MFARWHLGRDITPQGTEQLQPIPAIRIKQKHQPINATSLD
jgi:hypothetical protein